MKRDADSLIGVNADTVTIPADSDYWFGNGEYEDVDKEKIKRTQKINT